MTDFEFYCDEYGGIEITDRDEFDRLAQRARLFISRVTYCEPDFENDDVRCCLCAICEIYAQQGIGTGIKRERIDDYEVEYQDEEDNILLHTAKLYLPPVLLYRGF